MKSSSNYARQFSHLMRYDLMKKPGHPTSASPRWYQDLGSSHMEEEFSNAASDLADLIQIEHRFDDAETHHRYRVDFFVKDARLIIELDGHASFA